MRQLVAIHQWAIKLSDALDLPDVPLFAIDGHVINPATSAADAVALNNGVFELVTDVSAEFSVRVRVGDELRTVVVHPWDTPAQLATRARVTRVLRADRTVLSGPCIYKGGVRPDMEVVGE